LTDQDSFSNSKKMPFHPSLLSSVTVPTPLIAKRTMKRNEACWCGSGRKWKKCHLGRESQLRPNIHALKAEMRTILLQGYCSHPFASETACGEKIIRAHTIQKRGGLSAIAESGHVISVKAAGEDMFRNEGQMKPRAVGIHSASTFMGFCNRHDTEMFRPVECKAVVLDTETVFLLSFRAIAYEIFAKRCAIAMIECCEEMDKGQPFELQEKMQDFFYVQGVGLQRGLADVERWKSAYDASYNSKDFGTHSHFGIRFDRVLPVVGCGAFIPEYDFQGNLLQLIGSGNAPFEHVAFNCTAFQDATVVAFGWTGERDGPAETFVRSFVSLPDSEKADAVARLAFEHFENVYMRPSWWNSLSKEAKADVVWRMHSGMAHPSFERQPDCLRRRSIRFLDAKVTHVVGPAIEGAGEVNQPEHCAR
jgi:SEC-C motif